MFSPALLSGEGAPPGVLPVLEGLGIDVVVCIGSDRVSARRIKGFFSEKAFRIRLAPSAYFLIFPTTVAIEEERAFLLFSFCSFSIISSNIISMPFLTTSK